MYYRIQNFQYYITFTARSILNETKINLYKFLVFYVIYCLNFLSWLLIYFYHKHYKNNHNGVAVSLYDAIFDSKPTGLYGNFHNVLFLYF